MTNKIDDKKVDELVTLLSTWHDDTDTAAVLLHCDKKTGKLKSISPLIKCSSIAELYDRLWEAKDAISLLLNDLIDKKLPKN